MDKKIVAHIPVSLTVEVELQPEHYEVEDGEYSLTDAGEEFVEVEAFKQLKADVEAQDYDADETMVGELQPDGTLS